ncbi:hypothetical protein Ntsu_39530 [Nocardia sp. IFM 10818]
MPTPRWCSLGWAEVAPATIDQAAVALAGVGPKWQAAIDRAAVALAGVGLAGVALAAVDLAGVERDVVDLAGLECKFVGHGYFARRGRPKRGRGVAVSGPVGPGTCETFPAPRFSARLPISLRAARRSG